jgi:hypothetical protein
MGFLYKQVQLQVELVVMLLQQQLQVVWIV